MTVEEMEKELRAVMNLDLVLRTGLSATKKVLKDVQNGTGRQTRENLAPQDKPAYDIFAAGETEEQAREAMIRELWKMYQEGWFRSCSP